MTSITSPRTSTSPNTRRRRARVWTAVAGAAVVVGSVVALADGASAQAPRVVTNELADEISTTADGAVAALDEYTATGDLDDYLVYARQRTATARLAARELGYNEFAMIDAWKSTPIEHQRAVLAAMTQVGVPYRRNTSIEDTGFDCSGLTTYAWAQAGHALVRQSGGQIREAAALERSEAKAGDLVQYPGHVMMFLGVGDAVIHSVQTGRSVEVDTISNRRHNSVRFGDPTL